MLDAKPRVNRIRPMRVRSDTELGLGVRVRRRPAPSRMRQQEVVGIPFGYSGGLFKPVATPIDECHRPLHMQIFVTEMTDERWSTVAAQFDP